MAEKICICKVTGKRGDLDIPEKIDVGLKKTGGLGAIRSSIPGTKELKTRSQMFKALSDPNRIKILYLLKQQDLCVCLLKEFIDMSDSKLSYHINILKENGLIKGNKEGSFIIYRLTEKGREFV